MTRLLRCLLLTFAILVGGLAHTAAMATVAGAQEVSDNSEGGPDQVAPVSSPTVEGVPEVGDPRIAGDNATLKVDAPNGSSNTVMLMLLLSVGSILPGLLMVTTTFPRFLIVLGLARQALGLQTTPPNQLLAGLAFFMTLTVMGPVFGDVYDEAVKPALDGTMEVDAAIEAGWAPLQGFMLDHTRSSDLNLFIELADIDRPATPEQAPPGVVIPAFVISELRTAFIIGFLVWVPFLLVDLIVATVLSALGMLMMPPVVVSLPIKIALFVLVDGWALLIGSLVRSVG